LYPQILVLDSSVFTRIGLDIVTSIRSVVLDNKILLVGVDSNEEAFLRCVRAGVVELLTRTPVQSVSTCDVTFS
jgi:response regulator of citrate/malate metabolism